MTVCTTTNFLKLSQVDKLTRVADLQTKRDILRSESRKKRVRKSSTKRRKRKPTFFSPEIEKIFYKMTDEMQKYISGKGK